MKSEKKVLAAINYFAPQIEAAKEAARPLFIDQIRETNFERINIDTLIKIVNLIDDDETQIAE